MSIFDMSSYSMNEKIKYIIDTFNKEVSRCKTFRERNDWVFLVGKAKKIASDNDLIISKYESVLLDALEILGEIALIDLTNRNLDTHVAKLGTFNKFLDNCNQVDWTLSNNTEESELDDFNEEINIEITIKNSYIKEIKEIVKDMHLQLANKVKKITLKGEESPDSLVEAMMRGEL